MAFPNGMINVMCIKKKINNTILIQYKPSLSSPVICMHKHILYKYTVQTWMGKITDFEKGKPSVWI